MKEGDEIDILDLVAQSNSNFFTLALKHKRETCGKPTFKIEESFVKEVTAEANSLGIRVHNKAVLNDILNLVEFDDYIPYEALAALTAVFQVIYKDTI